MINKIIVSRLPLTDKAYARASFKEYIKSVRFIPGRDDVVLLDGIEYQVNNAGELAEALVTGHWDERVEFYKGGNRPIRYLLEAIGEIKVSRNPSYSDKKLKKVLNDEIEALLDYTDDDTWLDADYVIQGLSKKLGVSVSRLNSIFDNS